MPETPPESAASDSHRLGPPLTLALKVRNLVTRKLYEQGVFIVEFEPQGVVIEVPISSFLQGQTVALEVSTHGLSDEIRVEAEGKITRQSIGAPDRRDDELDSVTVRFTKVNDERWDRLVSTFKLRQAKVAGALEALKK